MTEEIRKSEEVKKPAKKNISQYLLAGFPLLRINLFSTFMEKERRRKMKKVMALLVIVSLLLVSLPGCSSQPGFDKNCKKQLVRVPDNEILGGVCTGIERRWDLDRWLCRGGFAVVAIAGGSGILLYLFSWIFVPNCSGDCGDQSTKPECKDGTVRK